MAKKSQVSQKVPLETKLKIVKMHLEDGRSAQTLAREFEVSSDTIYTRISIYKRDGGLDIQQRVRAKGYKRPNYKERYEILKKLTAYIKEVDTKKRLGLSTIIHFLFILSP
jgi:transposase-like protein